jgi:hypothetical protein
MKKNLFSSLLQQQNLYILIHLACVNYNGKKTQNFTLDCTILYKFLSPKFLLPLLENAYLQQKSNCKLFM